MMRQKMQNFPWPMLTNTAKNLRFFFTESIQKSCQIFGKWDGVFSWCFFLLLNTLWTQSVLVPAPAPPTRCPWCSGAPPCGTSPPRRWSRCSGPYSGWTRTGRRGTVKITETQLKLSKKTYVGKRIRGEFEFYMLAAAIREMFALEKKLIKTIL